MEIDRLIKEAHGLVGISPKSPKYMLWRNRVEAFVGKNYDEKTGRILQKCLRSTRVFSNLQDLQNDFNDKIGRVVEFLAELKDIPTSPQNLDEKVRPGTLSSLHPLLVEKCSNLYINGSYAESVEKSFKIVRDRLRELSDFETGSEAFGKGKLFISGASAKNVELDFQQAVKFLTMAIDFFRNEKSHTSDGKIDDPTRAYEYLALSSLALHLLDGALVRD